MTNWIEANALINQAQSILVVTHVKPDGDAIGSLLGLTNALRENGKQVTAAVDGGVPDFLQNLPSAETVINDLNAGQWDVMVSVDASDEERTGKAGDFGRQHSKFVINLDHHPTNTLFGNVQIVVPGAVSATEIVFDWLISLGFQISQPVATALLTGLVTDTIGFRTSNVVPRTLAVAHELMIAGASLVDIIHTTLVSKPYSHIELWKQVFPSVNFDEGVASAVVLADNLEKAGLTDMTDGGLVSTLVAANEVVIAVVFKVEGPTRVEISFRSKVGYDVGQVAFSLGGGGHRQASGVTLQSPLDNVKAQVMPLLKAIARQGRVVSG